MASVSLAESPEDPPGADEECERLRLHKWRQEVRVLNVAHVLAAARCDLWCRLLAVLVAVTPPSWEQRSSQRSGSLRAKK
jgi:hypothetical protein